VHGPNGQHYCLVHIDENLPEALYDALGYNPEIVDTPEGPIRVGLNETNGIDSNTPGDITKYSLTDAGLYSRDLKSGVVRKWNEESATWDESTDQFDNPDAMDESL